MRVAPYSVIPAQAEIQRNDVIPAQAGIQNLP